MFDNINHKRYPEFCCAGLAVPLVVKHRGDFFVSQLYCKYVPDIGEFGILFLPGTSGWLFTLSFLISLFKITSKWVMICVKSPHIL